MSHDYEGPDTEPMLRHDHRSSSDPRRTGYGDREPERFAHDPPDDAPRQPYRCRLCRDRGVYMGAATGWKAMACPRCAVDERRTA